MKMDVESAGDVTVVRPAGKLDALTSPQFQEAISDIVQETAGGLVIDLSDVPYVSSAGLRVFIQAAKSLMGKGKLAVSGLNDPVRQVFELAGFEKLMSICEDVETAKQNVAAVLP